jgi:CRISPR/Cas system-associated endonuclease Cas3-HD
MGNNQEKKKNRILIIGVSFFGLLFFSLWLFSINRIIFSERDGLKQTAGQNYWRELQEEISTSFMNMNQVWEELSTSEMKEEADLFITEFKNKVVEEIELKEEENKIEEEDLLFTNNNCPEFVNCMPTYNSDEEICLVPPGCENITLKVY